MQISAVQQLKYRRRRLNESADWADPVHTGSLVLRQKTS